MSDKQQDEIDLEEWNDELEIDWDEVELEALESISAGCHDQGGMGWNGDGGFNKKAFKEWLYAQKMGMEPTSRAEKLDVLSKLCEGLGLGKLADVFHIGRTKRG